MSETAMVNRGAWIVCERTGRWAAALRLALAKAGHLHGARPPLWRVLEVRTLVDLDNALCDLCAPIVLIEVDRRNFSAVLESLSRVRQRAGWVGVLLDPSLRQSASPGRRWQPHTTADDALREAGALKVVDSPRHVAQLLAIAARHSRCDSAHGDSPRDLAALREWAWNALPWQDG